jgi:hypothetical protein
MSVQQRSKYMKRRSYLLTTWLTLIACSLGLYAPAALAAAANNIQGSGQALEIAPPVLTLSSDPGKTIKAQISLRDISSGNLIVTNQINDFVAAGEDGTPKLLLDNQDDNDPYSLRGWIKPIPQLIMIPHQIKVLPIAIDVPANATPGGHYGAIRFTASAPELHGTGVSLATSLGALVLIKVNGNVKEQMSIEEFSVMRGGKKGTLFETTPLQFVLRMKNEGNTHEQPVGRVLVKDMFGKDVASVNINLPPRNVLPASIRRFGGSLDSSDLGSKRLFGRYTANLTVTYGANKQTVNASLAFWIIPYKLIAAIIAALVIGFFVLRFAIRRYNRRVINRYTARRR